MLFPVLEPHSTTRLPKVMAQPISDTDTVGEVADETILSAHRVLYFLDGIFRSDEPSGMVAGQHGQVIEVIAGGEDFICSNAKSLCEFD